MKGTNKIRHIKAKKVNDEIKN